MIYCNNSLIVPATSPRNVEWNQNFWDKCATNTLNHKRLSTTPTMLIISKNYIHIAFRLYLSNEIFIKLKDLSFILRFIDNVDGLAPSPPLHVGVSPPPAALHAITPLHLLAHKGVIVVKAIPDLRLAGAQNT